MWFIRRLIRRDPFKFLFLALEEIGWEVYLHGDDPDGISAGTVEYLTMVQGRIRW